MASSSLAIDCSAFHLLQEQKRQIADHSELPAWLSLQAVQPFARLSKAALQQYCFTPAFAAIPSRAT